MEQNVENQFEQFEKKQIIRRQLLPIWIKVFCWIFMIMGGASILCLITGLLGFYPYLSFYGFETNKPISLIGMLIITIIAFKGFTAYSLWFEKENAINLGKIDSLIGIVICIISMLILPLIQEGFKVTVRLEILFLILFYLKLNKIEYAWDNLEEQ